MDVVRDLASAAALVGHQARAAMLWSLVGGESRPAGELAMFADISPQAASNHLRLLVDAGLLQVTVVGRHRFFRLAGRSVATALEALAVTGTEKRSPGGVVRRRHPELVFARICYDHLAGELGVALLDRLRRERYVRARKDEFQLTTKGEAFLDGQGVDVGGARVKRRRFACACPDWSERVAHLGGALGAGLLDWLLRSRFVARRKQDRGMRLTETGEKHLERAWGMSVSRAGRIVMKEAGRS